MKYSLVGKRTESGAIDSASGAGGRKFESCHPDQYFLLRFMSLAPPPVRSWGFLFWASGPIPVHRRDFFVQLSSQKVQDDPLRSTFLLRHFSGP